MLLNINLKCDASFTNLEVGYQEIVCFFGNYPFFCCFVVREKEREVGKGVGVGGWGCGSERKRECCVCVCVCVCVNMCVCVFVFVCVCVCVCLWFCVFFFAQSTRSVF